MDRALEVDLDPAERLHDVAEADEVHLDVVMDRKAGDLLDRPHHRRRPVLVGRVDLSGSAVRIGDLEVTGEVDQDRLLALLVDVHEHDGVGSPARLGVFSGGVEPGLVLPRKPLPGVRAQHEDVHGFVRGPRRQRDGDLVALQPDGGVRQKAPSEQDQDEEDHSQPECPRADDGSVMPASPKPRRARKTGQTVPWPHRPLRLDDGTPVDPGQPRGSSVHWPEPADTSSSPDRIAPGPASSPDFLNHTRGSRPTAELYLARGSAACQGSRGCCRRPEGFYPAVCSPGSAPCKHVRSPRTNRETHRPAERTKTTYSSN